MFVRAYTCLATLELPIHLKIKLCLIQKPTKIKKVDLKDNLSYLVVKNLETGFVRIRQARTRFFYLFHPYLLKLVDRANFVS